MRITLQDVANSRIPLTLGLCREDYPRLASYVNEAQQRLINAGGENGWWGSWDKAVFDVDVTDPYITVPSRYARMINIDVCRIPTRIQNEWYEFLEAGIGLQRPCANGAISSAPWCATSEGFDRNMVPTAFALTPTNQYLRAYYTDPRDIGTRILISNAVDGNGNKIYSQDVLNPVNGFYLTLAAPFITSGSIVTSFFTVGKPKTYGDILLYQVDATTAVESLLSRFEANEVNPEYRRYFLKSLPFGCCTSPSTTGFVQVTALLKLEFTPVVNPSDFLIIGNIPALKEECESIRYDEMDNSSGAQFSILKHRNAIRQLNIELDHYLGVMNPAINVAPWGSAHLANQAIGILT